MTKTLYRRGDTELGQDAVAGASTFAGRNQQPTETYLVLPARLADLIETIER